MAQNCTAKSCPVASSRDGHSSLIPRRRTLPGTGHRASRSGASTAGGFISQELEHNRASDGAMPSLNNQLHHNKHIVSWTASNICFGYTETYGYETALAEVFQKIFAHQGNKLYIRNASQNTCSVLSLLNIFLA